jgi:hypothetical protein
MRKEKRTGFSDVKGNAPKKLLLFTAVPLLENR